jgi:hypothetical protein
MYAVFFEGRQIVAAIGLGLLTVENYLYYLQTGAAIWTADQIEKYLLSLRNTN